MKIHLFIVSLFTLYFQDKGYVLSDHFMVFDEKSIHSSAN